ncbi:MAG TPA: hypothetical protein VFE02_12490 [Candidatus Acidoferrales bacterium]|jgi:hypothetical protein|nr:hypothetical protein [Candidatus Acidoferrales bacterium]
MKLQSRLATEEVRREVVDERRAAYLLGLPQAQLREISEMSGLGRMEGSASALRMVFTYEELHKLCQIIVGPSS